MRGFKIAHATLARKIHEQQRRLLDLEQARAAVPRRIPVGQRTAGEVIKLSTERKHLTKAPRIERRRSLLSATRSTPPRRPSPGRACASGTPSRAHPNRGEMAGERTGLPAGRRALCQEVWNPSSCSGS
jgi:hypothetical protein